MNKLKIISCFLIAGFFALNTNAQNVYHMNWKQEASILSGSAVLVGASQLIENAKKPLTASDILLREKNRILSFDKSALYNYSVSAADASDLFKNGIFVVPFALMLSEDARKEKLALLTMYTEVVAVNGGITNMTKVITGRYRPYTYNGAVPMSSKLEETARRSFFSGHVSHVASLSFFTASVFADYYPDSPYRYVVWAGAITAPAVTGYLRYKAGMHFPSDVVVGYGVGAVIGYLIPKLHRGPMSKHLTITSVDSNVALLCTF